MLKYLFAVVLFVLCASVKAEEKKETIIGIDLGTTFR